MAVILMSGVITALGIVFILAKLDIRKVLWLDWAADIFFSFLLMALFAGTYSGMVVAMVAGVVLSIVLIIMKRAIGHKKLTRRGWVFVAPKGFGNDNYDYSRGSHHSQAA